MALTRSAIANVPQQVAQPGADLDGLHAPHTRIQQHAVRSGADSEADRERSLRSRMQQGREQADQDVEVIVGIAVLACRVQVQHLRVAVSHERVDAAALLYEGEALRRDAVQKTPEPIVRRERRTARLPATIAAAARAPRARVPRSAATTPSAISSAREQRERPRRPEHVEQHEGRQQATEHIPRDVACHQRARVPAERVFPPKHERRDERVGVAHQEHRSAHDEHRREQVREERSHRRRQIGRHLATRR